MREGRKYKEGTSPPQALPLRPFKQFWPADMPSGNLIRKKS